MSLTRRDLSFFLPAILAADNASGKPRLPSKTFDFSALPVQVNPETKSESRQVFDGLTHDNFPVDLHLTTLPPGTMPHPAHHHSWEEIIFVQTGTLEVTIKGNVTHVGPGGVIYVASNDEHGWKNSGNVAAQYFVLATGQRNAV